MNRRRPMAAPRRAFHALRTLSRRASSLLKASGPRVGHAMVATYRAVRRRGAVTDLLLSLSGTNRSVLAVAPGEGVKQAAAGGVILMTAGLGALSFGFALRLAVHAPLLVSVALGLLWGMAIANLDRWLVAASSRQPTVWKNLVMALPRVALAVVIGMVVSTPLTLQIFSSEINDELTVMRAESKAAFEVRLAHDPRYRDLPALRARLARLQDDIARGVPSDAVFSDPSVADLRSRLAAVDAQLGKAEQAVVCEQEGTCGSGHAGSGPAFKEKVRLRDHLQQQHNQLQSQLDTRTAQVQASLASTAKAEQASRGPEVTRLQQRIATMQASRDAESADNGSAVNHSDGLLARLEALHRIGEKNPAMGNAHTMLFVFLTSIECLPVIFKFLLTLAKPSLYEQLVTLGDEAVLAEQRLKLEARLARAEMEAGVALEAHETRMRNQLQAEVEAAKAVLASQTDMAHEAVRIWRAEQERRIASDIEAFVTSAVPVAPAASNEAFVGGR